MRPIDADRLCENCEEFPRCKGEFKAECAVCVEVAAQPTIDPASLRPKGEWVQVIYHVEFVDGFTDRLYECCSRCHEPNGRRTSDFCPNCGADMRGEAT